MKRKPKPWPIQPHPRPLSERRRGEQGRTASPLAKEGEGNKASPPAPLQGEGSRMLRKWRAKRAQLGSKR